MKDTSNRNPMSKLFRVALLAVGLFALCPLPVSAAPVGGEAAKEEQAAPSKKSLFETIKQGGWVMIPIGLCSLFTIYLCIDLYTRLSEKKLMPPVEVEKARQAFMAGDYVNAYQAMNHPAAAVAVPPLEADPVHSLSPRERQILAEIARGASNKEIARTLAIAEATVKIHVQHILRKLNLSSRVQAAVFAAGRSPV